MSHFFDEHLETYYWDMYVATPPWLKTSCWDMIARLASGTRLPYQLVGQDCYTTYWDKIPLLLFRDQEFRDRDYTPYTFICTTVYVSSIGVYIVYCILYSVSIFRYRVSRKIDKSVLLEQSSVHRLIDVEDRQRIVMLY